MNDWSNKVNLRFIKSFGLNVYNIMSVETLNMQCPSCGACGIFGYLQSDKSELVTMNRDGDKGYYFTEVYVVACSKCPLELVGSTYTQRYANSLNADNPLEQSESARMERCQEIFKHGYPDVPGTELQEIFLENKYPGIGMMGMSMVMRINEKATFLQEYLKVKAEKDRVDELKLYESQVDTILSKHFKDNRLNIKISTVVKKRISENLPLNSKDCAQGKVTTKRDP